MKSQRPTSHLFDGTTFLSLRDRRPIAQIGGFRAYLHQIAWSLRWQFQLRKRLRAIHTPVPAEQRRAA